MPVEVIKDTNPDVTLQTRQEGDPTLQGDQFAHTVDRAVFNHAARQTQQVVRPVKGRPALGTETRVTELGANTQQVDSYGQS